MDYREVIADFLHLLKPVARKDNGVALGAALEQSVAEHLGIDGVEAAEGLIQEHKVGFVQDGCQHLHFLLVAFG